MPCRCVLEQRAIADHETLVSENRGGGPRVRCVIATCRVCRWSWIVSGKKL